MTIVGLIRASIRLPAMVALVMSGAQAEDSSGFLWDIKGITISTHRAGRELGDSEVLVPTLESIRETGANWVAIHPYARIRSDGMVTYRWRDGDQTPAHWTEPIRIAHEQGMKICIKPHLAHWRSGFSWRGDIAFEKPEEWKRFWEGYTEWITTMAEACKEADLFVVGTELDRTVHYEVEWRNLIRRVRARTRVPITFASNWDAFEKVPFWDALDLVGIQSYFPISTARNPSRQALEVGWTKITRRLRGFSWKTGKKIVLTELGYNQSFRAASEPWTYTVDPGAEPLQLRCMTVALNAIASEPAIVGSFLWKWFPEPRPVGRNFQLATTNMRSVIRDVWKDVKRVNRSSEEQADSGD